jgi:hypothetical protein
MVNNSLARAIARAKNAAPGRPVWLQVSSAGEHAEATPNHSISLPAASLQPSSVQQIIDAAASIIGRRMQEGPFF